MTWCAAQKNKLCSTSRPSDHIKVFIAKRSSARQRTVHVYSERVSSRDLFDFSPSLLRNSLDGSRWAQESSVVKVSTQPKTVLVLSRNSSDVFFVSASYRACASISTCCARKILLSHRGMREEIHLSRFVNVMREWEGGREILKLMVCVE